MNTSNFSPLTSHVLKIASIVGARPQFIKLAPIAKLLSTPHPSPLTSHVSPLTSHLIIHTGQHYDYEMSQVFFEELGIKAPDYHLGVGSGPHGWQTAEMIKRIEEVLLKEKPHIVIVYGDTNSTLAGALAAAKLHIPIAHVEAGLRSFNKKMPEEINRILTDHCSDILFCPTETAVNNLYKEGFTNIFNNGKLIDETSITSHLSPLTSHPSPLTPHVSPLTSHISPLVINIGDIMYDALLLYLEIARKKSNILKKLKLTNTEYYLATLHRAENTDNLENLRNIFEALVEISKDIPIILPLHPRTKNSIKSLNPSLLTSHFSLRIIDPVSYFDMLILEANAKIIFTDSGGVQKEAFLFKVPCITLRNETEWIETVQSGWNMLVGADREKIINAQRMIAHNLTNNNIPSHTYNFYGDGRASKKIIKVLLSIVQNKL